MLKKPSSIQLDSRVRGNDGVAFYGNDGVVIFVYFVIPAKAGIHFFDFRTFIETFARKDARIKKAEIRLIFVENLVNT